MSSRRPTRPGSNPFTLIELLFVIAVIAILISMLLPALQGARLRAKLAMCTAHLHHNGVGLGVYAADHDGYFPDFGGPPAISPMFGNYTSEGQENLAVRLNGFGNMTNAPETFFTDYMSQDVGAGPEAYFKRPLTRCPVLDWRSTKPYMWNITYRFENPISAGSNTNINQAGYAYWTGRKWWNDYSTFLFDTLARRYDGNEVLMTDVTCGKGNTSNQWNYIQYFFGGPNTSLPLNSFTPHNNSPTPQPGLSVSANLLIAAGAVIPFRLDEPRGLLPVHVSAKVKRVNVTPAPQPMNNGPYFVLDE